jgi:hypothetical protein
LGASKDQNIGFKLKGDKDRLGAQSRRQTVSLPTTCENQNFRYRVRF